MSDHFRLARLAKAGFRRHRECIECERPSLLAAPSSLQRLQVRARSLDGVTALGSPSLWNTQRVNRARSHRYWHQSDRASYGDQRNTPDFGSSVPEPMPRRRGHLVHPDPKLWH